jgi:hypothetical protein
MKLDPSVPFVNQIFSFMQGKVSAEVCIQTLQQYEQKWNVEHVAPQLDVYVENYVIRTRSPEKYSHIVGLNNENGLWEKHVVEQYYGFLSETHLVLDTMRYSDTYDVILSNKYSLQATARAWGDMYAVWANQSDWLGRSAWTYLDFYANLAYQIDAFSEWAEAVYNIVLLKTKQEA